MSLVSVKLPKRSKKDDRTLAVPSEAPRYPYGLEISLDNETLKRLGMKLPRVGESMKVRAVGSVTAVRESERRKKKERNVQIQLEKLEVVPSKKQTAEDAVSAAVEKVS